ncbi:hypothetical protein LNP04_08000 [Chryseobacterium sp. C-71]|uniref:hypothetical protein n=1 Tax=Chryseobacterium sp. C-71 TaxID=2893882 RepID=UPI001E54C39A|nr:hypothetical protein [Chryseobacterium sp. C-71]UFH33633.1 hypothetical protein LNP04_08000 [Chryseobacterium sp. C-71]
MSTPKDFLDRLKLHFRFEPIIEGGLRSEEFSKITKYEFENFENNLKEKLKNYNVEGDDIVDNLVQDVLPILTLAEQELVKNVAFGKIYNTKINAFCAKSQDGLDHYCIVINEGLLMLLHKYGKLLAAQGNPKIVAFCNREDISKIKSKDYSNWANELIANYKIYKAPVGAMLKLTTEGNMQHGFILHFQELFVLCHELGHLFNKDLEDKRNLTNLMDSDAEIIEENKHYEIEYKADSYAFELISRIAQKKYKMEKKNILPFVVILFDIMALINPNQTNKHPAAIDRIMNIIRDNWGQKIADEYLKTYNPNFDSFGFFNKL